MSDMREAFEKHNPIPFGVVWLEDNYYALGTAPRMSYHIVKSYRDDWELWQAAQAESEQIIAGLQDQLNRRIKTGELVDVQSTRITELEEQEARLQALLKEKDDALHAIADPDSDHPIFIREGHINGINFDRIYEEIAQKALSDTSPTDALERHRNEVLEEAATYFENRVIMEWNPTTLRSLKRGE